eukprot:6239880-Amphidinium_carterae.1
MFGERECGGLVAPQCWPAAKEASYRSRMVKCGVDCGPGVGAIIVAVCDLSMCRKLRHLWGVHVLHVVVNKYLSVGTRGASCGDRGRWLWRVRVLDVVAD